MNPLAADRVALLMMLSFPLAQAADPAPPNTKNSWLKTAGSASQLIQQVFGAAKK